MEDRATSTALTCVREHHSAAVDVLLREPRDGLRGPRPQTDEAAAAAVSVVGQQEGDVRGPRVRVDGRCSRFIIWPLNAPLKAPGGHDAIILSRGFPFQVRSSSHLNGMQG